MRANVRVAATGRRTEEVCRVPCFKQGLVRRLRRSMPSDATLEATRALFAALADRTRIRILHALASGEELCVCDVANVLAMSISAASHHLRRLRDLGIVQYRTDGKMAYYSLRDELAAELAAEALQRLA